MKELVTRMLLATVLAAFLVIRSLGAAALPIVQVAASGTLTIGPLRILLFSQILATTTINVVPCAARDVA